MKLLKLALAASMLLCLTASAAAQKQTTAPDAPSKAEQDSSRFFQKARAVGDATMPSAFEFELSGYSYHISSNGAGRRTKGDEVRRFNLRLDNLDWIERVSYQEYQGNVLLVWWVNNGGEGGAFVARLEQPSMRARWKRPVPTLNVGAVREQDSLYVNGFGFIARLDLRTGEYLWRHDHVQGEGPRPGEARKEGGVEARKVLIPSTDFEPPEFKDGVVIYRQVKAYNKPPLKTIHVERRSGKIIRVE